MWETRLSESLQRHSGIHKKGTSSKYAVKINTREKKNQTQNKNKTNNYLNQAYQKQQQQKKKKDKEKQKQNSSFLQNEGYFYVEGKT